MPTLLVARTDADSAKLLTSDVDERDRPFSSPASAPPKASTACSGGLECAIARGLAYAPYADLVWCETSTPDLDEARQFAEAIRSKFPDKMLAYNCSPSFNWKKNLDEATIATLPARAGRRWATSSSSSPWPASTPSTSACSSLAREYAREGMAAYSELQQAEFGAESNGYTATRHQREVGTGYFDDVAQVISSGAASTLALHESTEAQQF